MPLAIRRTPPLPPSSDPRDEAEQPDLIRSSLGSLLRLRGPAAGLSLEPRVVRASQNGAQLSAFKGRGMEFAEARPYEPGDDPRTVDWRVTARTGRLHTKLFSEERERPVYLWVDHRRPMFFATRGRFKSVVAGEAAALVGWAAHHHGDRVGGLVFSEHWHHELRPARGRTGVLRLLKQLTHEPEQTPASPAEEREAMGRAVARLRRLARPGSLIFLLSDFRHMDGTSERHLGCLARHSDLVLVFVQDPFEAALPRAGCCRLTDGVRELALDTRNNAQLEHYQRQFRQRLDGISEFSRRHRAHLIPCSTRDDPLTILARRLGTRHGPA